jgi:hypothetical protein
LYASEKIILDCWLHWQSIFFDAQKSNECYSQIKKISRAPEVFAKDGR